MMAGSCSLSDNLYRPFPSRMKMTTLRPLMIVVCRTEYVALNMKEMVTICIWGHYYSLIVYTVGSTRAVGLLPHHDVR